MADRCLPPQRTTEWIPRGLLVSGIYIFTCVDNVRICCRDIRVCVCAAEAYSTLTVALPARCVHYVAL